MNPVPAAPPESPPARSQAGLLPLLGLLVLASGSLALVYELVWFKRLAQLLGSSTMAISCAVGSFLAGLGLGAFIGGRLAPRLKRPLFGFAACELGVALWALASIVLFQRAGTIELPTEQGLPRLFAQVALALALIGPPATFMGAGLPFAVQAVAGRGSRAETGRAAAWLYGLNSAGAGIGAFVGGFYLLGRFGLTTCTQLAAATNAVLALVAFVLFATRSGRAEAAHEPTPRPGRLDGARAGGASPDHVEEEDATVHPGPVALRFAAFLFGAGAMGLEIAWTRDLAILLSGSTYAFSAVLAVYVFGLGVGSLALRLFARRLSERELLVLGVCAVVGFGLLGRHLAQQWPSIVGALLPQRASATFDAVLTLVVTTSVIGGACAGLGFLFPVLVASARSAHADAGRAFGDIGFWNTAGTLIGVTVAAWTLVPLLTTHYLVTASLAVFPLGLLLLHSPRRASRPGAPLWGALLCGAVLVLPWPKPDPRVSHFGMAIYGAHRPDQLIEDFEIVEFRQGRSLDVLVLDHEEGRTLRVNGKVDASDSLGDMPTQLGLGVIPRLLRPEAREVLMIGFGSGVSSGAALALGGARVTCCEIEPEVFAISPHFHHVNGAPETHPDYVPVTADGRHLLATASQAFDVIASAPSNPWMSGVSNLFTDEFYALASARLSEGGLLAQWLQLYAIDVQDVERILATVARHFPHVALLRTGETDAMIVASSAPVLPTTPETCVAADALLASTPRLSSQLEEAFGAVDTRVILLQSLWLTESGVRRWVDDGEELALHTDDRLQLEFRAPRRLFDPTSDPAATPEAELLRRYEPADIAVFVGRLATGGADAELDQAMARALGARASSLRRAGRRDGARRLLELAELVALSASASARLPDESAPGDPVPQPLTGTDAARRVDRLLVQRPMQRMDMGPSIEALVEGAPIEAMRLALGLTRQGEPQHARPVLERLSERYPDSVTAWIELARVYARLGKPRWAEAAREKALRLDPHHPWLKPGTSGPTPTKVDEPDAPRLEAEASSTPVEASGPRGASD